jgi:hypothetical protein
MHIAVHELGGSLYSFSLFESTCLLYKTSLLACLQSFPNGGGTIAFYGLPLLNKKQTNASGGYTNVRCRDSSSSSRNALKK